MPGIYLLNESQLSQLTVAKQPVHPSKSTVSPSIGLSQIRASINGCSWFISFTEGGARTLNKQLLTVTNGYNIVMTFEKVPVIPHDCPVDVSVDFISGLVTDPPDEFRVVAMPKQNRQQRPPRLDKNDGGHYERNSPIPLPRGGVLYGEQRDWVFASTRCSAGCRDRKGGWRRAHSGGTAAHASRKRCTSSP